MSRWDVMTFGDLCVDLVLHGGDVAPEFGQKEKMVGSYDVFMGGSCSIFASQCAKLGLKTAVVGRLGEDTFAPVLLEEMKRAGVDTRFVISDSSIRTGLTCVLQQPDDRAMLTVSGSIGAVRLSDAPDELLCGVRHLHIGSYYLMGQLQAGFPDLLRNLKSRGATVSLDTNWDPNERWDGLDELTGLVDVFLPNENEVRAITGLDVEAGAEALSRKFPVVAVKLGERGAMALTAGQRYFAEARKVAFADAVGAGDSFDSGFVYGWLSGRPIEECLRFGCICGSMNVTMRGGTAGQPTLDAVKTIWGEDASGR